MKKSFMFIFMLVISSFFVMTVKAEGCSGNSCGTVSTLTTGEVTITPTAGNESEVTVTYNSANLPWSDKDPAAGRNVAGWWLGIKFTAPTADFDETKAKFTRGGKTINFSDVKDGENYFGAWTYLDDKKLEGLTYPHTLATYVFDWNGDGTNDQTVKVVLNEGAITLADPAPELNIVKVTIGNRIFTVHKDSTLDNLSDDEKEILEKMLVAPTGKVLDGIYTEAGELFTKTTPITSDITLHVVFKNASTSSTPEKEEDENTPDKAEDENITAPEAQKEESNPNTGDKIIFYLGLTVVSIAVCTLSTKKLLKRLY